MRIDKPLFLLLGSSLLALAEPKFTQADALWTANQTFASPIVDDSDLRLMGGDLIQVGYFSAVDINKDPADYTPAEWNSFIALTGDGSLNPHINNTFIDFGIPGFITFSAPFNTDEDNGVPLTDVRIGLRIYDAPTVAGASHFNLVSGSTANWIMKAPGSGINVPFPAQADLDKGLAEGSLTWLGTPFKTDLVPGPPPVNLVLTSVRLVGPTSLEVSWTGGDGSNDVQTSTTGQNFTNVLTGATSPAVISVDPENVEKLLVRVVEP